MRNLLLYVYISLLFISCSKDRLTASGDKITEERNPGNFTGISGSGSNPIHVVYGADFKVTLRGSDNLIPRFKTKVMSNVLYLEYEQINVRHDDIEVFITMPLIDRVSLSGSGDVKIKVREVLKASISGSGKVYYWGSPLVNSDISGSGKVIKL